MLVRCPPCHRESMRESNPWRPFCSERSLLTDLGTWAAEQYRIAAEERSSVVECLPEPEPTG
ncbi:MAG: DNA gyrase inhibitor YacG [Nitrospiraceae bacterium]